MCGRGWCGWVMMGKAKMGCAVVCEGLRVKVVVVVVKVVGGGDELETRSASLWGSCTRNTAAVSVQSFLLSLFDSM